MLSSCEGFGSDRALSDRLIAWHTLILPVVRYTKRLSAKAKSKRRILDFAQSSHKTRVHRHSRDKSRAPEMASITRGPCVHSALYCARKAPQWYGVDKVSEGRCSCKGKCSFGIPALMFAGCEAVSHRKLLFWAIAAGVAG